MKRTFISIIIPVYNVEKYLRVCLDSIFNVDFHDYELILVIGDSSDASNSICREYQKNKGCIIIEQCGKGLSNARNCGLEHANGEYIMYVDSDDFLDSKAFAITIEKFCKLQKKKYDILISDFFLVDGNDCVYACRNQIEESEEIIESYDYLKKFLSGKYNYWNVWRYIYRRAFLQEYALISKENYKSEDIDYSTQALLTTNRICYYHNPYYCYRVRRVGSLVNAINMQNIDNLMEILADSIYKVRTNKEFLYKRAIIDKLLWEYTFSTTLIYDVELKDKSKAIKKISRYRYLLKYGRLGCCKYWIISILGIKGVGGLLHLVRQFRRKLLSNQ